MRTRLNTAAFWFCSPSSARARTHLLFGLLLVGLCAACLATADQMEGRTVARWQLASDVSVLMSCSEEPSSTNEPLWCANPDSPHCTRDAPAPTSSDSWLGPVFAVYEDAVVWPALERVRLASTPSPAALLGYAQAEGQRLERPPRRA